MPGTATGLWWPFDRFRRRCFPALGVPAADADLSADSLVRADLWSHQSHGVMRAETRSEFVVDAGAVAVMDCHDGVGQVLAAQAAHEAIRRAKAHGVGTVAVRNSNHFGGVKAARRDP
jgi:LDH2 family malate/lactate/ureidoglycolate dehydrogenase